MMRKEAIIYSLLLIIAIALVSCTNSNNQVAPTSNNPTPANTAPTNGAPDLMNNTDINAGLDNNINNVNDPSLDPNSLG